MHKIYCEKIPLNSYVSNSNKFVNIVNQKISSYVMFLANLICTKSVPCVQLLSNIFFNKFAIISADLNKIPFPSLLFTKITVDLSKMNIFVSDSPILTLARSGKGDSELLDVNSLETKILTSTPFVKAFVRGSLQWLMSLTPQASSVDVTVDFAVENNSASMFKTDSGARTRYLRSSAPCGFFPSSLIFCSFSTKFFIPSTLFVCDTTSSLNASSGTMALQTIGLSLVITASFFFASFVKVAYTFVRGRLE